MSGYSRNMLFLMQTLGVHQARSVQILVKPSIDTTVGTTHVHIHLSTNNSLGAEKRRSRKSGVVDPRHTHHQSRRFQSH
jgi:hypothetical protein